MVVLHLIKFRTNEKGYLLLESLVTLSIIVTILLLLYPLIVDWLLLREQEKEKVEHTRLLYETSMQWPETHSKNEGQIYSVHATATNLTITKNNREFGVKIYEVEFD